MKEAYYFPHDANAHRDSKILQLRIKLGWEGVGLFWSFVELLRESNGYKMPLSYPGLSLALATPEATLEATLKACLESGLLVEKDGYVSSPSLDRRMGELERRRDLLRQAGRRGYEIKAGLSQAQATLKPGLSSKGKERKGNIKVVLAFVKPTLNDITTYCKERENGINPQAFVDHYESNGWKVGRNPMRDWRAAVRQWERRPEFNAKKEKGEVKPWA